MSDRPALCPKDDSGMRDVLSIETQEIDVARNQDTMVAAGKSRWSWSDADEVGVGGGGHIVAAAAKSLGDGAGMFSSR